MCAQEANFACAEAKADAVVLKAGKDLAHSLRACGFDLVFDILRGLRYTGKSLIEAIHTLAKLADTCTEFRDIFAEAFGAGEGLLLLKF